MSDVFLSYSSADREIAALIARALEQGVNVSVWWDRQILVGRTFDSVIQDAIDSAKCMVVIWSQNSIKSDWLFSEASEGKKREILIPVLVDEVQQPLEFRRIQAAWLVGWSGDQHDPHLVQLCDAVRDCVVGHPVTATLRRLADIIVDYSVTNNNSRYTDSHRTAITQAMQGLVEIWNHDFPKNEINMLPGFLAVVHALRAAKDEGLRAEALKAVLAARRSALAKSEDSTRGMLTMAAKDRSPKVSALAKISTKGVLRSLVPGGPLSTVKRLAILDRRARNFH